MTESRLIGLTGYKQSGKSTVAALLVEHGWTELSFAEPIKEMALAIDPWIRHWIRQSEYQAEVAALSRLSSLIDRDGWERAKKYMDVREFLQRLGTEAGRHVLGLDVWVNLVEAKIIEGRILNPDSSFVIPDVRFINEAAMIRGRGGTVVRVFREGQVSEDDHASEQPLPDEFVNFAIAAASGDVAGLRRRAKALLL